MTTTDDGDQQAPTTHLHGIGGSPECQLCPICVVLQAVGSARPDITRHLLGAARELALAVKALAEGQVEATDHASAAMTERLRRITVD